MRMGLRDANQRFSEAIKAVRAGREVILTDRGRPFAVIQPLPRGPEGDEPLQRLGRGGLLRRAAIPAPMPRWTPRRLAGPPITQTLREERDGRG